MVKEISTIPMKYIAAGSFSASISKDRGELFIWGTGVFGKFVLPKIVYMSNNEEIKSISIGNQFSIALSKIGSVYSWGINS